MAKPTRTPWLTSSPPIVAGEGDSAPPWVMSAPSMALPNDGALRNGVLKSEAVPRASRLHGETARALNDAKCCHRHPDWFANEVTMDGIVMPSGAVRLHISFAGSAAAGYPRRPAGWSSCATARTGRRSAARECKHAPAMAGRRDALRHIAR